MKILKKYLKRNIDDIDEHYLILLYKIVSQFPRKASHTKGNIQSGELAELAQKTNFEQHTLPRKPKATFGSARGLVHIGPDFDQPIEGFEN